MNEVAQSIVLTRNKRVVGFITVGIIGLQVRFSGVFRDLGVIHRDLLLSALFYRHMGIYALNNSNVQSMNTMLWDGC